MTRIGGETAEHVLLGEPLDGAGRAPADEAQPRARAAARDLAWKNAASSMMMGCTAAIRVELKPVLQTTVARANSMASYSSIRIAAGGRLQRHFIS
ncbi:MAG TPA: hypothetical protein VGJ29_16205 [Vicinamibacterales bacterium]